MPVVFHVEDLPLRNGLHAQSTSHRSQSSGTSVVVRAVNFGTGIITLMLSGTSGVAAPNSQLLRQRQSVSEKTLRRPSSRLLRQRLSSVYRLPLLNC